MTNPSNMQSLATALRRQQYIIALILFVGVVSVTGWFTFYKMADMSEAVVKQEALTVLTRLEHNPEYVLPSSDQVGVFREYKDLPDYLQRYFPLSEIEANTLYSKAYQEPGAERDYLYIYMARRGDFTVFLTSRENADITDKVLNRLVAKTLSETFVVASLIFIVLFGVISWVFKQAQKPVLWLSKWSEQVITGQDIDVTVRPEIVEIDTIANQLFTSIEGVRQANERESQFLKYASHELRTPLATMQASLDTIHARSHGDNKNQATLARALKANSSMILLTDTLLWLSRESTTRIAKSQVNLSEICNRAIEDFRYLDQEAHLEFITSGAEPPLLIEKPLLDVVINNVIRNAFQHAESGGIHIICKPNALEVINQGVNANANHQASFGIGLQLVERIANEMKWQCEILRKAQTFTVSLRFS